MMGFVVLPVFRPFSLTWLEILRLLILTVGLWYCSRKLGAEIQGTRLSRSPFAIHNLLPVLLTLGYMFIIIQFDPATSAVHDLRPQSSLNWFFLISSGLICLAVGAGLLQRIGKGKKKRSKVGQRGLFFNLNALDKYILVVCGAAILLVIFSRHAFSLDLKNRENVVSIVKMSELLILWFLITRTYPVRWPQVLHVGAKSRGPLFFPRLQMRLMCSVFTIVVVAGVLQLALAAFHFSRGNTCFARNEMDRAKREYQLAQRRNRFVTFGPLRRQYLRKLAVIHLKTDSTTHAEQILSEIRESASDSVSVHETLAHIFFEAERWDTAASHYRRYLKSRKGSDRVLDNLALCYLKMEDNQGLSHFVSTHNYKFRLDIVDPQALIVLGKYYLETDRNENAVQVLESLEEGTFRREYYLGKAYGNLNRFSEAKGHFSRAVEIEPDFADGYFNVGRCWEAEGNLDSARIYYEKTIERLPNHLEGLEAVLRIYTITGFEENSYH